MLEEPLAGDRVILGALVSLKDNVMVAIEEVSSPSLNCTVKLSPWIPSIEDAWYSNVESEWLFMTIVP